MFGFTPLQCRNGAMPLMTGNPLIFSPTWGGCANRWRHGRTSGAAGDDAMMAAAAIFSPTHRFRCERSGTAQEALASLGGGAPQTIIDLEAQRYAPAFDPAFRIVRAFEAGVEDVLRRKRSV